MKLVSGLKTFLKKNQRIRVQSVGLSITSENPKQTLIPIIFELYFIPMFPVARLLTTVQWIIMQSQVHSFFFRRIYFIRISRLKITEI